MKKKTFNHRYIDRDIFENLLRSLDKKRSKYFWEKLICEIGRFFLDSPYKAGALERKGPEALVINLREFDCFTFIENLVALFQYIESKKRSFESFKKILKNIRYRKGILKGYTSRLHYYSDWIYDNQRKGILKDITREIGGVPLKKVINFMTTHPELYPKLKDSKNFRRMKEIEGVITQRPLFFIPKRRLKYVEDKIMDGDLIGITARVMGLDIQHAGIAIRIGGEIHLLHASRREGKVVVSKKSLQHYLMKNKDYSGIMVARLNH